MQAPYVGSRPRAAASANVGAAMSLSERSGTSGLPSRATVGQVMLAWCLRHKHVFAVPKTSRVEGVTENAAAADLMLAHADLAEIDRDFPPPNRAKPLEML